MEGWDILDGKILENIWAWNLNQTRDLIEEAKKLLISKKETVSFDEIHFHFGELSAYETIIMIQKFCLEKGKKLEGYELSLMIAGAEVYAQRAEKEVSKFSDFFAERFQKHIFQGGLFPN